MKEFKLVLTEAKDKDFHCYDCIFYINSECCEPYGICCVDDRSDITKEYYWKLEEIKQKIT